MFRKKKKKKDKILYQKYLEIKKQKGELDELAFKLDTSSDKIVIKKVSFAGKFFEIIMDLFYRVGKIMLWILACLIMSAGAVALLNPQIRDIILNYLPFAN